MSEKSRLNKAKEAQKGSRRLLLGEDASRFLKGLSVQRRRLVRACGIVVFAGVVLGLTGGTDSELSSGVISPNQGMFVSMSSQAEGLKHFDCPPEELLERIEEYSAQGSITDQTLFSEEIAIPHDAEELRFDQTTSIMSFVMDDNPPNVMRSLTALWNAQGWQSFPLGGLEGATFIKEEGICRWMMVTCTEIGTQTCVVVNPIRG